jgi:hypothetical protein
MGKSAAYWRAPRLATPTQCLGCHKPIVYGDRCQRCQQELRQRRKRKPR